MNERDYLIMEIMVLAGGCFVCATIIMMMLIYSIVPDVSIAVVMGFVGFSTFFFGLLFHMKRRIFILEMEALAKNHTNPEQSSGSEK